MDWLVGLALALAAALPWVIALRRSNELFRLRVQSGAVRLVRGRLPGALLHDIEDVFARTRANAEIRVVSENLRPRAIIHGVDGALAQQVRNVVGRFALAEIRAGRTVPRSRTLRRV